jgi:Ca-activated chloride channel family protein
VSRTPRVARRRHVPPLVMAALALLAPAAPRAQQSVFKAAVDSVRVDVEVRRGGRPVLGLTAADFEIVDDGVRQRAELVSTTTLPLNVVLALDGSASLAAPEREHLVAAGRRLIDALRPGETAALVTFSDRVAIQTLFTDDLPRLRTLVAAPMPIGDTALHDAAHVSMLLGGSAPGRGLIILLSNGNDTASLMTGTAVIDTARRTGAVVCVVTVGAESAVLPKLADMTGGVFVKETSLDRVAARFGEFLESFRERYLVSFTPTRRGKAGWHPLAVKVKGGGDVRARSGYWAESTAGRP